MTALILVGLVPFAALGIASGTCSPPTRSARRWAEGISLLALLGGVWFPLGGSHGFLHDLSQCIPSYWLVQASHVALGGRSWSATGWAVMVAWTVVLSLAAARAYRRDTGRVSALGNVRRATVAGAPWKHVASRDARGLPDDAKTKPRLTRARHPVRARRSPRLGRRCCRGSRRHPRRSPMKKKS